MKNAQNRGCTIGSRGICFAGMLALKVKRPEVCLEMLALRPRSLRPTPLNNLRAMALANLGRIEDAIEILRQACNQPSATTSTMRRARPTIFIDTLDTINAVAFEKNDKDIAHQMRNIENALRDGGHVISGQRFDDFLGMTIKMPKSGASSGKSSSKKSSRVQKLQQDDDFAAEN